MTLAQGLARPAMRSLSAALWSLVYNLVGLGLGPLLVGAVSDRLEPAHGPHALRYGVAVAGLAALGAAACFGRGARAVPADLARARG
jgi:hypothetical protein